MAPHYTTFNHNDLRTPDIEEKPVPGESGGTYFDLNLKRSGKDAKGQIKEFLPIYDFGVNKTSGIIKRTNNDGTVSTSVHVWWGISNAQFELDDNKIIAMTDDEWAALDPSIEGSTPIYIARKNAYEEERSKLGLKNKDGGDLLPPYNEYILQQKKKIVVIMTVYVVTQHIVQSNKARLGFKLFDVKNPDAVSQFYKSPIYWPPHETGKDENGEVIVSPKPTGMASTFLKLMTYEKWSTGLSIMGMGKQPTSIFEEDDNKKFRLWNRLDIYIPKVYVQKSKAISIQVKVTEMTVYNFEERTRDDDQESREAAEANPEASAAMAAKIAELTHHLGSMASVPDAPSSPLQAIQAAQAAAHTSHIPTLQQSVVQTTSIPTPVIPQTPPAGLSFLQSD
jgi:hypothetical protein